jgi:hypothetical protein
MANKRSSAASTRKRSGGKTESRSAFASPSERKAFEKQIEDEKQSSTLISRRQRKLNELGMSVGVGGAASSASSAGATASDVGASSAGATTASTAGASGTTASTSTSGRR